MPKSIYKHQGSNAIEIVDNDQGIRSLYTASSAIQSSMDTRDPIALVLSYTRSMMAFLLWQENPQSALLIGLGGGSLAKHLLNYHPTCHIDVIEIEPNIVTLAHRYFHLPHDSRLNIHITDGYTYLRECQKEYDVILVDAFDKYGVCDTILHPAFFDACAERLASQGILSVNLWSSQREVFTQAIDYIRQSFDANAWQLPVAGKGNVIALAAHQPLPRKPWSALRDKAVDLEKRYGLEFSGFVRELQRWNKGPSLLQRLLG